MYLKFICLYWVMVCILAAPPTDEVPSERQQPSVIPIISLSAEYENAGKFKYSYETGNGIKREETAYDKESPQGKSNSDCSNEGGEDDDSDEIHVQKGSYSYTAPDGTIVSVRYIADENGFQPIITEVTQSSNKEGLNKSDFTKSKDEKNTLSVTSPNKTSLISSTTHEQLKQEPKEKKKLNFGDKILNNNDKSTVEKPNNRDVSNNIPIKKIRVVPNIHGKTDEVSENQPSDKNEEIPNITQKDKIGNNINKTENPMIGEETPIINDTKSTKGENKSIENPFEVAKHPKNEENQIQNLNTTSENEELVPIAQKIDDDIAEHTPESHLNELEKKEDISDVDHKFNSEIKPSDKEDSVNDLQKVMHTENNIDNQNDKDEVTESKDKSKKDGEKSNKEDVDREKNKPDLKEKALSSNMIENAPKTEASEVKENKNTSKQGEPSFKKEDNNQKSSQMDKNKTNKTEDLPLMPIVIKTNNKDEVTKNDDKSKKDEEKSTKDNNDAENDKSNEEKEDLLTNNKENPPQNEESKIEVKENENTSEKGIPVFKMDDNLQNPMQKNDDNSNKTEDLSSNPTIDKSNNKDEATKNGDKSKKVAEKLTKDNIDEENNKPNREKDNLLSNNKGNSPKNEQRGVKENGNNSNEEKPMQNDENKSNKSENLSPKSVIDESNNKEVTKNGDKSKEVGEKSTEGAKNNKLNEEKEGLLNNNKENTPQNEESKIKENENKENSNVTKSLLSEPITDEVTKNGDKSKEDGEKSTEGAKKNKLNEEKESLLNNNKENTPQNEESKIKENENKENSNVTKSLLSEPITGESKYEGKTSGNEDRSQGNVETKEKPTEDANNANKEESKANTNDIKSSELKDSNETSTEPSQAGQLPVTSTKEGTEKSKPLIKEDGKVIKDNADKDNNESTTENGGLLSSDGKNPKNNEIGGTKRESTSKEGEPLVEKRNNFAKIQEPSQNDEYNTSKTENPTPELKSTDQNHTSILNQDQKSVMEVEKHEKVAEHAAENAVNAATVAENAADTAHYAAIKAEQIVKTINQPGIESRQQIIDAAKKHAKLAGEAAKTAEQAAEKADKAAEDAKDAAKAAENAVEQAQFTSNTEDANPSSNKNETEKTHEVNREIEIPSIEESENGKQEHDNPEKYPTGSEDSLAKKPKEESNTNKETSVTTEGKKDRGDTNHLNEDEQSVSKSNDTKGVSTQTGKQPTKDKK